MTKKEKIFLKNYNYATCTSVKEFYKQPSTNKIWAENRILDKMKNDNGHDYAICGGNCMTFTCGYLFTKDGKDYLKYFTAYNTYEIEIA